MDFPVDEELEERYLSLMGGFSRDEWDRIPLKYTIYSEDFRGVIEAFIRDPGPLDSFDLLTLQRLIGELYGHLNRQLRAIEFESIAYANGSKTPLVNYEELHRELEAESTAVHNAIVLEYFFLSNLLDLVVLVQRGVMGAFGDTADPAESPVIVALKAKIVAIFQGIDGQYERTQQEVAAHRDRLAR